MWIRSGGVLCLVGAVLALIGGSSVVLGWRLQRDGQTGRGIVDETRLEKADENPSGHTRHVLSYSFTTTDGRSIRTSRAVDLYLWQSLHRGDSVHVVYLPDAPDTNRLEGEPAAYPADRVAALVGVLMVAGGIVLAVLGVRWSGQPAAVRVQPHGRSLGDRLIAVVPGYIFAGFLLGSIGVVFIAVGGMPFVYAARFTVNGRQVRGVVLAKSLSITHGRQSFGMSSRSSSPTDTPVRSVQYRFDGPSGVPIDAEVTNVATALYDRLSEGGPVTVEYLTGRPNVSRLADNNNLPVLAYVMCVLGLLLAGGGVAIVILWPRRSHRPARSRRRARPSS